MGEGQATATTTTSITTTITASITTFTTAEDCPCFLPPSTCHSPVEVNASLVAACWSLHFDFVEIWRYDGDEGELVRRCDGSS